MVEDEDDGVVGEEEAELHGLDAEGSVGEGEPAGEAMGCELVVLIGVEGDGDFEGFIPEPRGITWPEDGGDDGHKEGHEEDGRGGGGIGEGGGQVGGEGGIVGGRGVHRARMIG